MLRYKRRHFIADGLAMPKIAEEFLGYANEESAHADRLARRIVELGGAPDFSPDSLTERSYVAYDDSSGLEAMIRGNQTAERVVVQSYGEIIRLIGDKDPVTRHLLQDILSDEQVHAEELKESGSPTKSRLAPKKGAKLCNQEKSPRDRPAMKRS